MQNPCQCIHSAPHGRVVPQIPAIIGHCSTQNRHFSREILHYLCLFDIKFQNKVGICIAIRILRYMRRQPPLEALLNKNRSKSVTKPSQNSRKTVAKPSQNSRKTVAEPSQTIYKINRKSHLLHVQKPPPVDMRDHSLHHL